MDTDEWPVKHIYISRRLTTDIVERHIAADPSLLPDELSVDAGGIGFKLRQQDLDLNNRFVLAREATKVVANRTGSIGNPNQYLRASLELHACGFNLFGGWERETNVDVAGFCASQWVDGVGRVFVALFGSLHNFIGYQRGEREATGWSPSDAYGLYQLLADVLEPEDPRIRSTMLENDRTHDDDYRCRSAATIFYGIRLPPAEPLEFLAETFIVKRDFHLQLRDPRLPTDPPYDVVVVGTPIWVAKVFPREFLEPAEVRDVSTPDVPPEPLRKPRWRRLFAGS
jgi:hypothetical protein